MPVTVAREGRKGKKSRSQRPVTSEGVNKREKKGPAMQGAKNNERTEKKRTGNRALIIRVTGGESVRWITF